jgi:hypothetical protein
LLDGLNGPRHQPQPFLSFLIVRHHFINLVPERFRQKGMAMGVVARPGSLARRRTHRTPMIDHKPILLVEDDDLDAKTVQRALKELHLINPLLRT